MEYTIQDRKTAEELVRFRMKMGPFEQGERLLETLRETDSLNEESAVLLQKALTAYDLAVRDKKNILEKMFPGCSLPEEIPALDEASLKSLRKTLKQKESRPGPRKLYISDLHFYHQSLNRQMDFRGFGSYHEMNEYMIEQWNRKVTAKDEVYILGDLSIAKGKATNEIVRQLKGRLHLIEGNHDRYLKDREFEIDRFKWVRPYAEINDNGRKVILSHYPIFCYNGQYKRQDGVPYVYMLYGHVHNSFDEELLNRFIGITAGSTRISRFSGEPESIPCNMINCFCMFSDYQPQTLDEWIETDRVRREALNLKQAEEGATNAEGE